MPKEIEYANWWSKALFRKAFENQFVIPVPPPAPLLALMEFLDRMCFSSGLDAIRIDRPIFIVGLPRSGTSMLYNLLCAHERAAFITTSVNSFPTAIGTMEWIRKKFRLNVRGERFLQDSIVADFGSPSEPATFWGKWIGRDAQSLYWPEKRLADFAPEKIQEIHDDVKRVIRSFGDGDRRFIVKYPVFQTELRTIQDLFPDAHFIHIIRDGRMVANSLIKLHRLMNEQIRKIRHPELNSIIPYPRVRNLEKYVKGYGPEDIRCAAHVWQDSIEVVNAVRGDLRHFMEIRYEDILQDPRGRLGQLFDFAGLAWPDPANAVFAREFADIGQLQHSNRYGQFETVEKIAEPTLRAYGYL